MGDGIPDWWKLLNGLSVTGMVAGAVNTNSWAHGLTNWQIYQNPSVTITNNFSTLRDGVPDWWKSPQGYSLLDSNVSAALTSLIGWWKLDEGNFGEQCAGFFVERVDGRAGRQSLAAMDQRCQRECVVVQWHEQRCRSLLHGNLESDQSIDLAGVGADRLESHRHRDQQMDDQQKWSAATRYG